MKLQKFEKLDKEVISSIKIYARPFTSVIRFDSGTYNQEKAMNLADLDHKN